MTYRLATRSEEGALDALGRDLLARACAMIATYIPPDVSNEDRSQEVGRIVLHALFRAAEAEAWLDRAFVLQGLGAAVGETVAFTPDVAEGFVQRIQQGMEEAYGQVAAAVEPRGGA